MKTNEVAATAATNPIAEWWNGLSARVRKCATIVTSVMVIVGATVALCDWILNIFTSEIDARIEQVESQITTSSAEQELNSVRIQLLGLIFHTPENKAEIERVAYHYFRELHGDWYMTGLYSQWAEANGGDIELVVSK